MTIEQGAQIAELYRRVNNLLRVGKVVTVDYDAARARVKIGNITTDFMPWLTPSTAAWIPLKNNEQVVVLSPNGDLGFGMILPALYCTAHAAPSSDAVKIAIVADIKQTGNTSMSGTLDTGGDITTGGKVTATGEVEGKGKKLSEHTHDFQYNAGPTPASATTKKPS
jgi:phage baseplate assembly protein gpV